MAEDVKEHIPYHVTSITKENTFTPDGRFVLIRHVGYETDDGKYHSFIDIPDAEADPARVDQVIQEDLDKVMGIHELGPEPHPENLPSAEGGPPPAE